jgi:hypothetical protein
LEGDDKPLIVEQSMRWQFGLSTKQEHKHISAVKNAARFLKKYPEFFPDGFLPRNSTQLAVLAIKVYPVFLEDTDEPDRDENDGQIKFFSKAIIAIYKRFESEDDN